MCTEDPETPLWSSSPKEEVRLGGRLGGGKWEQTFNCRGAERLNTSLSAAAVIPDPLYKQLSKP